MKRIAGLIVSLVLMFSLRNTLFAHGEWVHQHMVREAYKLLKHQLGYDIPIMKDHIGLELYGPGTGTWETGQVVIGAWREDIDDPVWNVGGIECGFVPSSTHFWDADAGDESSINIANDWGNCPYSDGTIPNAYVKAVRYYHGGYYLGYVVSPYLRVQKLNGDWLQLRPLVPPGPVYLNYENLAEVLRTKMMLTAPHPAYYMWNERTQSTEQYEGHVRVDPELIDKFVWEILGRIAHLLGDMSVPAHAHNDPHPCYFHRNYGVVTIDIQNGDQYELWAGGSLSGSEYNCYNPVAHVNGYDWGELQANQQGGFVNVTAKQNPLRYLFYCTNQLADHFGSLATQYAVDYGGLWNPGDNDASFNYGSDNYAELQALYSTIGPPGTDQAQFESSKIPTMNYPYTFAIRATAGLLYWFAREAGLILAPPVATAATNISSTSFTANWTSVSGATSYRLDVATDNQFNSILPGYTDLNVGDVLSKSVTGLNPNTTYHYRVRTQGVVGTSENSNTISVRTAPAAPTATAATNIASYNFTANWTSVMGATSYRLDVATDGGFTSYVIGYNDLDVGNVTFRAVTGLNHNTAYYYRVRAYNDGVASQSSNAVSATTGPPPPTATYAAGISSSGFTAFWNSAIGATSYRLDVAYDAGFTSFVSNYYTDLYVGNVTSCGVTGLTPNITYHYRVRAHNAAGSPSANSNAVSVTTLARYQLTVSSPCGLPTNPPPGEYWYDAGQTVSVCVTSTMVYPGPGTRYVFTDWSGVASTCVTVVMDGPKTVTANCNTQYLLVVTGLCGLPTSGSGWYNAGQPATACVTSTTVSGGSGIQYQFTYWADDASGTSTCVSLLMNGPKAATAQCNTQYYLTINSSYGGYVSGPPAGWWNAGSYIAYLVPVSNVCYYAFTGWSGSFGGTQNPLPPFYMNAPYTVTANFTLVSPSPPTWLSASTDGHSYVQLTWGGAPFAPSCVQRYMVYRRNPCGSWNITGASYSTSFLDHPPPSQICYDAYVYAVTVVDIYGRESPKSGEAWAYGYWH